MKADSWQLSDWRAGLKAQWSKGGVRISALSERNIVDQISQTHGLQYAEGGSAHHAERGMRRAGPGAGTRGAAHRMVPVETGKRKCGAVQDANDRGDLDLTRGRTQRVTPVRPSTTGEQPAAGELSQDRVQEAARNALARGNFRSQKRLPLPGLGELEQRPERVDGLACHHYSTNAIEIVPNSPRGACQAVRANLAFKKPKLLAGGGTMRLRGRRGGHKSPQKSRPRTPS